MINALKEQDLATLKHILDSGIDWGHAYFARNRPLVVASENGFDEGVQLLIDSGMDLNDQGWHSVTWAAEGGHCSTVELLIKNGADFRGETDLALRWAAQNGHSKTVKLLIDYGADPNAEFNYAIKAAFVGRHINVVHTLVEAGVDLRFDNDYLFHHSPKEGASYFMARVIKQSNPKKTGPLHNLRNSITGPLLNLHQARQLKLTLKKEADPTW